MATIINGDDDFNTGNFETDSSGYVSIPAQPRARLFYNASSTGFVNSLTFIENNGDAITHTSGKLYVPVSGWYSITVYGISTAAFDARLVKNTTSTSPFLCDFRQDTASTGHHGCGNTAVTYLDANDYVGLYLLSGSMYTSAGSTNPHNQVSIYYLG